MSQDVFYYLTSLILQEATLSCREQINQTEDTGLDKRIQSSSYQSFSNRDLICLNIHEFHQVCIMSSLLIITTTTRRSVTWNQMQITWLFWLTMQSKKIKSVSDLEPNMKVGRIRTVKIRFHVICAVHTVMKIVCMFAHFESKDS